MLFVCFVELDDSVTTAIIPDFCSIVLTDGFIVIWLLEPTFIIPLL